MDTPFLDAKQSLARTYKRHRNTFRVLYLLVFVSVMTFFVLKFFQKGEPRLDMKVTEYINKEMDRILAFKTREKQNDEFKNLKPRLPIEPIRMTLTTAVFRYTSITPNVILKRIIYNPNNNLNEDQLSMSLDSPYVCKTLKSFRTKRIFLDGTEQIYIWIFFELLDVKISQKAINGNEDKIRRIVQDSLHGLDYLHTQNIAHLDMKIGNIMGKTTDKGVVYKLIDFGYSQRMPSSGSIVIPKKNYGTYPYKPPEVVFKNEHGLKSDIWSLGAICWFLSLQYTPFYLDGFDKDLVSYRKFLKRRTGAFEERKNHVFVFNRNTSDALKDFVKKCMAVEPTERPTAKELLKHPFITKEKFQLSNGSEDEVDEGYLSDETSDSSSVKIKNK